MARGKIINCTKEEIDRLIESALDNDYYYMLFNVLKTTGRRIGELYGVYERTFMKQDQFPDPHNPNKIRFVSHYKTTRNLIGGVQVKDIDFERNVMRTQVLKRRIRMYNEAVLTPETAKLIKQYIITHKLKLDDYLFRKVKPRAVQWAVRRYANKAGINHPVVTHNFRHYFVTQLMKLGWTDNKIIKFTGHASSTTLQYYDHTTSEDFRNEALPDLAKL